MTRSRFTATSRSPGSVILMAGSAGDGTIEFDAPDGARSIPDVGSWIDGVAPVAAALLLLAIFWALAVRLLIGLLFPEDRKSVV